MMYALKNEKIEEKPDDEIYYEIGKSILSLNLTESDINKIGHDIGKVINTISGIEKSISSAQIGLANNSEFDMIQFNDITHLNELEHQLGTLYRKLGELALALGKKNNIWGMIPKDYYHIAKIKKNRKIVVALSIITLGILSLIVSAYFSNKPLW